VVKVEHLKALLDWADGSTLEGGRYEVILRVFIYTGARLSEVANLR
jgi:hypothetical protein